MSIIIRNHIYATLYLVLLLFLAKRIDWRQALQIVRSFRPMLLLVPFSLILIARHVQGAYNYYVLARALRIKLPFLSLVKIVLRLWGIGQIGIGRAAEGGMVYFLHRWHAVPLSQGSAMLAVDKLITLALLLITSALAAPGILGHPFSPWFPAITLPAIAAATWALLKSADAPDPFDQQGGIVQITGAGFRASMGMIARDRGAVTINVVNTLVRFGLYGITGKLLLAGLGADLPVLRLAGICIINQLLSLLPITMGNLGIQEAWYIHALGRFGVSAEIALSMSIMARALNLVLWALTTQLWGVLPLLIRSRHMPAK